MQTFIFIFNIILLIFILRVESTYHVYTYDNGVGDDEHCCFVRLGSNFCLAKPLTRSLLQANQECQRLGINGKNKNDLNKIVRRLNVEKSDKVGNKIIIQLKTPLDKNILKNDLLCLSSTNNNNINLEKCFIEVADDQQQKKKRKDRLGKQGGNKTVDAIVLEVKPEKENGIQLIQVSEPIQTHEKLGLTFQQVYELNLTDFRPTTNQQRLCWSWFRQHTKKLCNHPKYFQKTCISLNTKREKCLHRLFYKKINDNENESYTKNVITIGSKLYCEDINKQAKFLGYHRQSEICFQTHTQISIRHKFTDFVSLSDKNKNKHVLQFIANDTKLSNDFEQDCRDKTTLNEIRKSLEKQPEKPIKSDDKPAEQA
ncbi:unnamed protein product [Rotaria sordida]|uniref:Uncharacterized protein n=1 Tax=Rotaria sordida TaxID=392033 RepID=A0A814Q2N3_9BILA|nr:unnamed protein product [Rotaria sordida]CAF1367296.1 unnamed protein product [Rotaria sordida]